MGKRHGAHWKSYYSRNESVLLSCPNHGRHPASNARGANFSMWFTRYSHMFTKEAYDECHVNEVAGDAF